MEEEISVSTRQVERGTARIHTRVTEHPVEETVRLREEHVTVERHPVNRPATADLEAGKERTIEVTETVEEPVVSKSARVVEEVTVHKETQEHTETVQDTVRRQDVEVEQGATAQTRDVQGFETYAAAFRRHHSTAFASSGTAYEAYEPAYRYGYELSTNERYRTRLDHPGSRRPPGLGSPPAGDLGTVSVSYSACLGGRPRAPLAPGRPA